MAVITTFDLLKSPLEGTNLIEASAGTGKTYTIAGLVLRLVLEKNLAINEILAVTFTKAATGELRDRIRRTLRAAEKAFSAGQSDDPFVAALIKTFPRPEEQVKQLTEAIRTFDEAAIFTIHGFCQKVLHAHAFETGTVFDAELVDDETAIKQNIADDFWRRCFINASPLFVHYAVCEKKWSPDSVARLLNTAWAAAETPIIPAARPADHVMLEKAYGEAAQEVCNQWSSCRDEVEAVLLNADGLDRRSFQTKKLPVWMQRMDCFVAAQGTALEYCDDVQRFSEAALAKATKNGARPPCHPLFALVETLSRRLDAQRNCATFSPTTIFSSGCATQWWNRAEGSSSPR